jgi:hypothetical protein
MQAPDTRSRRSPGRRRARRTPPWRATALAALLVGSPALAGPADVVSASVACSGATCDFDVTVRHDDQGWDHYANAWQVVAPDGSVLATRVLRHPHVDEQPFTRGLRGVVIPPGIERVRLRARDSRHGFGGEEIELSLDRSGAEE